MMNKFTRIAVLGLVASVFTLNSGLAGSCSSGCADKECCKKAGATECCKKKGDKKE
jgi:hypothetical protein